MSEERNGVWRAVKGVSSITIGRRGANFRRVGPTKIAERDRREREREFVRNGLLRLSVAVAPYFFFFFKNKSI